MLLFLHLVHKIFINLCYIYTKIDTDFYEFCLNFWYLKGKDIRNFVKEMLFMGRFRKQPAYARVHEEEKYKFIKEQIRPQKKSYIIRFTRKVLETVLSAVVFGGVSGFVFWNINNGPGGSSSLKDKGISAMEYQVPENTAVPANSTSPAKDSYNSNDMTILEEHNKASKRLSAVGDKFSSSLVSIISKKDKPAWYNDSQGNTGDVLSGMVLKETARYYYILTPGGLKEPGAVDIEFQDGETVQADYLSSDSNTGLSVFCVEKRNVSGERQSKIVIPEFGSTISVPAGSNIIITGAPNGIMYSVMTGNIIKTGIEMPVTDNIITLFATDVLYTSNSNGIVLNTKGRVIGFVTNLYEKATGHNNIGFIGISSVIDIINSIVEGKNIPYLGIEGHNVDQKTASAHNISKGIYLTSVYSGSPAYSSGIRVADVITQIDGEEVSSLSALHGILKSHNAGDRIVITVSRKYGKKNNDKKLAVELE